MIARQKRVISESEKRAVRIMTLPSTKIVVCLRVRHFFQYLIESWQKHGQWVKWALVLVLLCFSLLPSSAYAADGSSQKNLLEFWRQVFLRPSDGAIQDKVSTAKPDIVTLGERLFGDTRLSGNENRSCASCHDSSQGFSDGRKRALGLDGFDLARNTPTLYNVAWGKSFNWDGRAASLEEQMLGPLLSKKEMAGDFDEIVPRLKADANLSRQFARAFPENPIVSQENIIAALAAFERTIVSPETRFDRWIAGDERALTSSEAAGFKIFVGKGGCVACHSGWRFTDDGFHDIGLLLPVPEISAVEAGKKGVASFKTPTLRSVRMSGPYMHDGSLENLSSVVDHYSDGIEIRKGLDALLQRNLKLSAEEKANLVAFLETL